MKKIILAIDSFKGCLTSAEVGQCVEQTIKEQIPYCQVIPLAVSDGGEGILDILVKATQGHFITIEAHDPLMRIRKARYGVSGDGKTAIIREFGISLKQSQLLCMFNSIPLQRFGFIVIKTICRQRRHQIH